MDSSAQPDRLSDLPDVLLVLIISCLSFKQCVQTSLLSKRWGSLHLERRNVSFKESDFLSPSVFADPIRRVLARTAFVGYMRQWVARMGDQPMDTFGISISDPQTYLDVIESLIAFAVQKRVKSLVLDFSNPAWRTFHNVNREELVVKIPQSVYDLTTLESLKVCACDDFDPSRLSNLENLKSVSFGWMELTNIEPLLKRLESLTLNHCGGFDFDRISGDMIRELVIKDCDFYFSCTFDLPRVDVFKYCGDIFCFEFDRMNAVISEVDLDFQVLDTKPDDETNNPPEGGMLCQFLNNLLDNGGRTATTLTVSPFLLKMIPRAEYPHLLCRMKTKHLVLKTKLHPTEFNGIRVLLINCPKLETLTLDLLPPAPLRETLQTVVVKNYVGGAELNIVRYLLRSGSERLERVELYMPFDLDDSRKLYANARSEMLQRSSEHVRVCYALNNLRIETISLLFTVLPALQILSCVLVEEIPPSNEALPELLDSNEFEKRSNDNYEDTNKSTTRRMKWHKQKKCITGAVNVMSGGT
ncbi:hypothetical protein Bca101_017056 [Brassica carinata]